MNDTYPQAVFFLRNDRDAIDRLILLMFGARGRHPRMAGARGSRPVIPYFALQQAPAGFRASVKKRGNTVVVQIGAAAAQHTCAGLGGGDIEQVRFVELGPPRRPPRCGPASSPTAGAASTSRRHHTPRRAPRIHHRPPGSGATAAPTSGSSSTSRECSPAAADSCGRSGSTPCCPTTQGDRRRSEVLGS